MPFIERPPGTPGPRSARQGRLRYLTKRLRPHKNAGEIMPRALSLHHLSNLDITAPELIRAAHGAGFSHVCLFTMGWPSPDFTFPVIGPGPLLDETRAALKDTGVKVFNTDAPFLWPDVDVSRYEQGLEIAASFGATNATAVIGDPDFARATDNFGKLYELAKSYGVHACIEFMMMGTVNSIQDAERMAKAAGADVGSITVDTLHLIRTGGSAADVAKLDPKMIGNVQINDGPATMPEGEPQVVEAMTCGSPSGMVAGPSLIWTLPIIFGS
ncbi:MAG: sugar phosphate isomerase/epimerase, partial [Caulobacteraceae bacterium]